MKALVNKVQLIGRLGADPKVKVFGEDRKVSRFPLATNEGYKNAKGEWIEQTQWHQVVAWGGTASLVERLLTKGQEVMVEGRLTTNSWEDKEGNKRFNTEITLNDFFLTQRKAS